MKLYLRIQQSLSFVKHEINVLYTTKTKLLQLKGQQKKVTTLILKQLPVPNHLKTLTILISSMVTAIRQHLSLSHNNMLKSDVLLVKVTLTL